TIEDATITGEMIAGSIAGVDITGGRIVSSSSLISGRDIIMQNGKLTIETNLIGREDIVMSNGSIEGGRIFSGNNTDGSVVLESGELKFEKDDTAIKLGMKNSTGRELLLSGNLGIGTYSGSSAGTTISSGRVSMGRWAMRSRDDDLEIRESGSQDRFELAKGRFNFRMDLTDAFTFGLKDAQNHSFMEGGRVAIKMTNSGEKQVQIRNSADTAYANFVAQDITTTGDVRIRGDLRVDGSTSGVSSLSSDEDTINVFDEIISLRKRIKELEGEA